MRKLLLLPCLLLVNFLIAQTISFNPRTGDVEMDGFLKDVNNEALKDINKFKDNVVTKFNIVKADVDKLLKDMMPGDVYMAAQVSTTIGKPVTEVSTAYNKNKDKGWGAIAKEMGIKPGSAEFHKLKKSMKKNKGGKPDAGNTSEDDGKGKGKGKGKNKNK